MYVIFIYEHVLIMSKTSVFYNRNYGSKIKNSVRYT